MRNPTHSLAVLGVAIRDDAVLLVQTHFGGDKWQLPGGFVEKGEDMETALKREFKEELNVNPIIEEPLGIYIRKNDIALSAKVSFSLNDIEIDKNEIKIFEFFKLDSLPEITPRTKRILEDTKGKNNPQLWYFKSGSDAGDFAFP